LNQGSEFYIRNLNDFKNFFLSRETPVFQFCANAVVSSEEANFTDVSGGVNTFVQINFKQAEQHV
ncbi:MAG: hypothetical protein ACPHXW_08745, partial [Marinobacterium sp.]